MWSGINGLEERWYFWSTFCLKRNIS
jgi:hypothetical protein